MVISALYAPAGELGDGLFVSVPLQMNKGIETKEPSPRLSNNRQLMSGFMAGASLRSSFVEKVIGLSKRILLNSLLSCYKKKIGRKGDW